MSNITDACNLSFGTKMGSYLISSEYYAGVAAVTAILPSAVAHLQNNNQIDKYRIIFETAVAPLFASTSVGLLNTYYAVGGAIYDHLACENKVLFAAISSYSFF